MKQILDIPYNIPSYREVKTGDVFVSFNSGYANDRKCPAHIHVLKVLEKEDRYAILHCEMIKCIHDAECIEVHECKKGSNVRLIYSDMKTYSHCYRALKGTAEVLFGENHELQRR